MYGCVNVLNTHLHKKLTKIGHSINITSVDQERSGISRSHHLACTTYTYHIRSGIQYKNGVAEAFMGWLVL